MRKIEYPFDDTLTTEPFFDSELNKPKRNLATRPIIAVSLSVLLVTIIAISSYLLIQYHHAKTALDSQEFIVAKQYLDKLPCSKTIFADEYAYASAGVLMEEGQYLEALKAFDCLENPSFSASLIDDLAKQIMDSGHSFELLQIVPKLARLSLSTTRLNLLKRDVYQQGQQFYHKDDLYNADVYFKALGDYQRSADYQLLIDLKHESQFMLPIYSNESAKRLVQIAGFEDSIELITHSFTCMTLFLQGRWESEASDIDDLLQLLYPNYKTANHSKDIVYFEMDDDYSVSYNLPHIWTSEKSYSIMDGIYYTDSVKQFKFSISNKDTITVFCYKDNSTYTLHRQ